MFSIVTHRFRTVLIGLAPIAVTLAAGCTVSKQEAPELSGPSAFGTSITAVASPDTLPRDGQSVSLVRLSVRDFTDKAVPGQRLTLATTAGTLSATDVTTDANGAATVQFTAPVASSSATSARISATPISELGVVTSGTHNVLIALSGPSVPQVSFAWTPSSPGQFDLVTFDATATTLNGVPCLDTCTYAWNFGDGISSANRITTHRFTTSATFSVTLTVTAPSGLVVTSTRSVVVGTASAITAVITQSPTDAKVGDTVIFDGATSSTPDGTAIVSYSWDFGNGSTATTRQATTSYGIARTYTVRLTIVDALGRTATTTKTVTIS
jgi:PKD repeat protein